MSVQEGRNNMKVMVSQPMKGKTEEQIRTERENLIEKFLFVEEV